MAKQFIALVFALALAAPVLGTDTSDVELDKKVVAAVVKDAIDGVMAVLARKDLSDLSKRAEVMKIIDPVVDFEIMAARSLGREWRKISASQQEEFTELFSQKLKRSYFDKLTLFTDEVVEFGEPRQLKTKGSPKYAVLTHIVLADGKRIEAEYQLYALKVDPDEGGEATSQWKVYNFVIEGVDFKTSYRNLYRDLLTRKTFEVVLKELREEQEAARKRESAEPAKGKAN